MVEMEHVEAKREKKIQTSVFENFNRLVKGNEAKQKKCALLLLEADAENHQYILTRLIRGLGSSKVSAKAGFFAALVALLNCHENVTVEEILELLNKNLHTSGNNAKSENADITSGQIFVYGALIHSNLFLKGSLEEQRKVLEQLVLAGHKRSYLLLAAFSFIIDLIQKVNRKQFITIIWPTLETEILKSWEKQTADTLYVLLEAEKLFPDVLNDDVLRKTLGTPTLISNETIKSILDILINVSSISSSKHPIYEELIKEIANSSCFVEFISCLDSYMEKSSFNKHLLAAKILSISAQNLANDKILPELFPKHFIRHTIHYFQNNNKNDDLRKALYVFFENIHKAANNDSISSKTKISLIRKLLFWPGNFMFEKITKTKLVQQVSSTLDADGVKKLIKLYKKIVLAETEKTKDGNATEKWSNADRLYAAQIITKLLGNTKIVDDIDYRIEQFKFLMAIGLFRNEQIGNDLHGPFKETFFNSLNQKISTLNNLSNILSSLLHFLVEKLENEETRKPLIDSHREIWKKTVRIVQKIENKKTLPLNAVFRVLFLLMGLQMFNEPEMAIDCLNELFVCYERTRQKNDDENGEEPLWIEVVVELFLNLLSNNSHFLRRVINCVFPHLCGYMNATAIQQILSVLDPKSNSILVDNNDEDESASDDEDENASGDDDEDIENASGDDDEDIENASGDDGDDDKMEIDEPDDKLRLAVQQALNPKGLQSDEESMDMDEMSDSELDKMDSALSEAFLQYKPNMGRKSKKQSKEAEALTHFRVRVLDLVEIYLDSVPAMMLALEIMPPLLKIIEFSVRNLHQKPLQDRAKVCLRKLSNLRKFSSIEDVNETVLTDLLKSLLEKGTRNINVVQDMDERIADCCVFIVRCVQFLSTSEQTEVSAKKLNKAVSGILQDEIKMFFTKRNCLTPFVLFKKILQLNWKGNCRIAAPLVDVISGDDVRPFKKSQALHLLKLFRANRRLLDSLSDGEKAKITKILSIVCK